MSNMPPSNLNASLVSDPYASHIAARLQDFFQDTTPWQRRLWDAGTVLTLRELFEASNWCAKGVLSAGAVGWLARDIERLAGKDRGVGERDLRIQLRETLRSNVPCESRHHRRLAELIEFVNDAYLEGWAATAQSGSAPSPERTARAIGSHLLDYGYSMRFLRQWRSELVSAKAKLGDLFDSAQVLATNRARRFQIIVPFISLPQKKELTAPLTNWLSASEVVAWLETNAKYPSGYRQNGGFGYAVDALDEQAAADVIRAVIDRLRARSSHGRGVSAHGPIPVGDIWISEETGWHRIKLATTPRASYVLSLAAEKSVYDVFDPTPIDDALELAAPLNFGAPGPAVSGGWAAIEALLVTPADEDDGKEGRGTVAADRMAVIIAASWPRGELTTLSYRHAPNQDDRLKTQLDQTKANSERARLVADTLFAGGRLSLSASSDRAAESRMVSLLASSKQTLNDVDKHMKTALRRLYRHRNILMHGGTTNSIAFSAALRTAAPLVGAGLDRITHASLVDQLDPLQLASRAQLNIDLAGGDHGRHVVDLLEGRPTQ